MKSKLLAGVLVSLFCLLFSNPATYGQGVGSSGSITGTVTDPQGGVLPKTSIVEPNTQRSPTKQASIDLQAFCRLPIKLQCRSTGLRSKFSRPWSSMSEKR
jgi:hypothetical protein